MSTMTTVYTYSHSVTYVTDQMLSSLKRIIVGLDLDTSKFVSDVPTLERGLKTWLETKHLEYAVLEIKNSSGLVGRYDFNIDYSYSTSDGNMWVNIDAIKYSLAKQGVKASECSYNIKVHLKDGYPAVSGWSSCEFLSTAGFIKQGLGTTIGTNSIGASANYWRKA